MTDKTYLMIYEGKKLLVEAKSLVEAMEAADNHFKSHSGMSAPLSGMWVAEETVDYTYEWRLHSYNF